MLGIIQSHIGGTLHLRGLSPLMQCNVYLPSIELEDLADQNRGTLAKIPREFCLLALRHTPGIALSPFNLRYMNKNLGSNIWENCLSQWFKKKKIPCNFLIHFIQQSSQTDQLDLGHVHADSCVQTGTIFYLKSCIKMKQY